MELSINFLICSGLIAICLTSLLIKNQEITLSSLTALIAYLAGTKIGNSTKKA